MNKQNIVTIEFRGIYLLGSFRLSIDGITIGESTFRKGCVLTTEVSSGKHILSTEIWPYWPSFITKKEFPFEIERDIQRKDYRLSYSRFWGKFSNLIVTNTVYFKEKTNKKDEKNVNVEETSIEKLGKLIRERKRGDITPEKFEEMKKEILGK
jgi:hypothetical protein